MEEVKWQTAQDESTVSLIDVIRVIVRKRWFIIVSTVIGAVFIVLVSFYSLKVPNTSHFNPMPDVYTATAQVRLLRNPANSLSQTSQSTGAGGLAALLAGSGASGPTNAELALALLKGNTLADEVTKDMGFVQRYHIKSHPLTSSRSMYEKALKASYSLTTGILKISYTNTDKYFATKVVNKTVDVLQNRFNTLNLEQVNADANYFVGRLASAQTDLQNAENKLIDFMNKYGIVDLQAQSAAQTSQISALTQQIQVKEVQLATLRRYGRTDSDPGVVQLKNEISILENQISQIRSGSGGFSATGIPADQLPRISSEYLSLKNNVAIQQSVYALIQQQYQTTKVQQNAAMQMLQIVERAIVPETKSGPHRSLICAAFTIAVFLIAVFIAFLREYFDRARKDPQQAAKLADIRESLGRNNAAP